MGQFQPGNPKPPNSGRKKGSKNIKRLPRLSDLLAEQDINPILMVMDLIAMGEMKDKDRADLWLEIYSYCQAKPKQVDDETDEIEDDGPLDDLSEDELIKLRELRLVKPDEAK